MCITIKGYNALLCRTTATKTRTQPVESHIIVSAENITDLKLVLKNGAVGIASTVCSIVYPYSMLLSRILRSTKVYLMLFTKKLTL
jgi:SUMO ligase MMS21 Smc5/6 complex component